MSDVSPYAEDHAIHCGHGVCIVCEPEGCTECRKTGEHPIPHEGWCRVGLTGQCTCDVLPSTEATA